jgi:YidC/Oxa1 family membrane protein insertase
MEKNRNFILAVALSFAVVIGWDLLYLQPSMDKARKQQQIEATQNPPKPTQGETAAPGAPASPGSPAASGQPALSPAFATRQEAIAASPRVVINSPALQGSINLKGARIDDVVLRDYHETVNPKSPEVVLLSPSGSPHPYFTYTGWWSNEPGVKLPGEDTLWQQEGTGQLTAAHPVVLRYDNGAGLIFRRTISVDDRFMFSIADEVENKTGHPVTLRTWGQVAELTEPKTLGYSVLHEGLIGVFGANGLKEVTYSSALKNYDPATKTAKEVNASSKGGWIGMTSQYWAAVLIPNQSKPFDGMMFGNEQKNYYANYLQEPVTVAAGGKESVTNRLFAGAKEVKLLEKYRTEPGAGIEKFNKLVDWGWFFFLTEPMFYLMDFLYQLVGNFGVAILLTTVVVKAAFFPLANKSFESMSKMKKLQPEMKNIQERFKDDKARQQEALMKLYKDEKVNPMAGCLPIFIQIPVFFSLYKVLLVAIEMRHAPFFGWIKDLSAPDPTTVFNLFGLIPWTPPQFLMLGVLPLAMGISMWVQMRLNPTPTDPVQQQVFTYMPIIFTFMLASFPAGLVLYWTWNNMLSFAQQAYIMKRQGVEIDILHNVGIKNMHGRVRQVRSRMKNNGRSRTPAE